MVLLCALALHVTSWAQQVQISPVPQSVTWGEKAFASADAKYALTKAETTDAYAVELLQNKLTIAEGGINITVGKKGEAAVSAVEANIPETAEGYYLKVASDGIVVAGADDAGTYYGVQTLSIVRSGARIILTTRLLLFAVWQRLLKRTMCRLYGLSTRVVQSRIVRLTLRRL